MQNKMNFLPTRLKRFKKEFDRYQSFVRDTHSLIKPFMAEFMAEPNLSKLCVLFFLHYHPDHGVNDIARALQISHPAVSQVWVKLVQEGLVEREDDPLDNRRKIFFLTEKGEQLVLRLEKVLSR